MSMCVEESRRQQYGNCTGTNDAYGIQEICCAADDVVPIISLRVHGPKKLVFRAQII